MLIGLDEYPFHQVTQTFGATAGSDPSWNDGHYICAADQAGTFALTSNVRLYGNNDVIDGFVCLRHDGRQFNVRVSRRLRPNMEDLRIGPLRMEIVEPLQTVRLVLEDNSVGITVDLTCHSAHVPYMGPIEIRRHEGRLLSERATYEITGTCHGSLCVGGERLDVVPETGSMFRNHSWGFQPGRGGPRPYGAPTPPRRTAGLRQWVLFDVGDHGGFFFVDPNGRAAAGRGAILTDDGITPVAGIDHDLHFYEGERRLRHGTFALTDPEGRRREYSFDDRGWVYCQGGGYFGGFDDGLGQGVFRGDEHFEGEVWDVSHPTTIRRSDGSAFEVEHDWAESFVVVEHAEHRGMGHYEAVVIR